MKLINVARDSFEAERAGVKIRVRTFKKDDGFSYEVWKDGALTRAIGWSAGKQKDAVSAGVMRAEELGLFPAFGA